ncbi:MAG: single-stranded DNA-binding protein [Ignavibacteriae bacterium]|jgi:single-strand DNA-binding protein|nr:single-stranded DNA-binding protein [Ignavibacteriota bacterium]NOH00326.1 single-stranded DNA-binding protein [Ignavibacteriota bacterium]
MAFSLNRIQLIGNLGQDAEHRFTTSNIEVTSFSMATTHSYKGKEGNWINDTTWHNIVIFSPSEFLKNNLKKGKKFYVEGRLSKRDYENKEGQKIYVTEVIADKFNIIPLDSGDGNYQSGSNSKSEPIEPNTEDDLPF